MIKPSILFKYLSLLTLNICLNLATSSVSKDHQRVAPHRIDSIPVISCHIVVLPSRKFSLENTAIKTKRIRGFENVSTKELI